MPVGIGTQSFYVGGPTFWYVGTSNDLSNPMEYLGVCEGDTRIAFSVAEEEVRTDLGGPMIPHDVQFMGTSASIAGTLARYDEVVFKKIASFLPNQLHGISGNQTPGFIPPQALGALYQLEQNAIDFVLNCPYNTKTVFTNMIKLYHFPLAWMTATHDVSISTRVKKIQVTMRAINKFTIGNYGAQATLWDQSLMGLGTLPTPT
jgi:hypothetical protein